VVWGTDFLRRTAAIIDFGAMTMTIKGAPIPLIEIKQRRTEPVKLTVLESISLRPGETRLVRCAAADGSSLGTLGHISTRARSSQEISVREGITATNDSSTVLLVVTNKSKQTQQLHAREEAAGWTAAGTEEPP
jgi:hypothetical protein